jgi:hypothetical protein
VSIRLRALPTLEGLVVWYHLLYLHSKKPTQFDFCCIPNVRLAVDLTTSRQKRTTPKEEREGELAKPTVQS